MFYFSRLCCMVVIGPKFEFQIRHECSVLSLLGVYRGTPIGHSFTNSHQISATLRQIQDAVYYAIGRKFFKSSSMVFLLVSQMYTEFHNKIMIFFF